MLWKLFTRKITNSIGLFTGHFVEVKAFYALQFDKIPCVSFIGELDCTEIYALILKTYQNEIIDIFQHNYYDHKEKDILFNNTIFILKDSRMIEIATNYCQVLYTTKYYNWAKALLENLSQFKTDTTQNQKVIGFAAPHAVN